MVDCCVTIPKIRGSFIGETASKENHEACGQTTPQIVNVAEIGHIAVECRPTNFHLHH